MSKLKLFTLITSLFLYSQAVYAQGMAEYGRVLSDTRPKHGALNPKAFGGTKQKPTDKGLVRATASGPSSALPQSLIVESQSAALHNRHDEWSDKLVDLPQGERLLALGSTTVGDVHWYMVKTQTGVVGWIKSTQTKASGAANPVSR
jgi:hypothetical protein